VDPAGFEPATMLSTQFSIELTGPRCPSGGYALRRGFELPDHPGLLGEPVRFHPGESSDLLVSVARPYPVFPGCRASSPRHAGVFCESPDSWWRHQRSVRAASDSTGARLGASRKPHEPADNERGRQHERD
jgi:hypothetical protein